MTSHTRLRFLADYLDATRNEIAVDKMFLDMAHVKSDQVGYLPRVPRWVVHGVRFPRVTRTIWRLVQMAWLGGGAIAFFMMEYLKFSKLHHQSLTAIPTKSAITEGAVIAFSTRVCDIVRSARFAEMPKAWITMPWAPQHVLPEDVNEHPLLTLVDQSDLRQALVDAVKATYALAHRATLSEWVLQSYTSFRWFLVRRAIDRVSGKLVMSDHFDRWAILADRSIRAGKRRNTSEYKRSLILIQHGTLNGLGGTAHARESLLCLPVRLRYVDELYAYNVTEEELFRKNVLFVGKESKPLKTHYFKPAIKLSSEAADSQFQILFVGHPLCEQFQEAVYYALQKIIAFKGYYKPHPKAPMSKTMHSIGWTIISEKNNFPQVDILISYPSTLVIEYEESSIPAITHPIDSSTEELSEFTNKALESIHRLANLKAKTISK